MPTVLRDQSLLSMGLRLHGLVTGLLQIGKVRGALDTGKMLLIREKHLQGEKASVLEALDRNRNTGQWQKVRDGGGMGLIGAFHLSRLFRELASVTAPLIF